MASDDAEPDRAGVPRRQGRRATTTTARRHYQRGIDLARQELSANAGSPAALLWLAGNLAGEALTHGRVFALRVIPEIEATLLRLEQAHPSYDHAAAARSLANLYWKAPAIISVGSSKKAARYFQLALERAPELPGQPGHGGGLLRRQERLRAREAAGAGGKRTKRSGRVRARRRRVAPAGPRRAEAIATSAGRAHMRRRILFVAEAVTLAQVVRLVTLARALDPARYDVHFASAASTR